MEYCTQCELLAHVTTQMTLTGITSREKLDRTQYTPDDFIYMKTKTKFF